MAEVYLAHDDVLDRDVALKVMSGRYADDAEFVERFKREAQSAAALSHPNIVSIYDRGEDRSGTYYIAMEYLPGGTLKDRILKRGALPPKTAAAVALQIAEALQAAHAKGVVHRDIKPHNVLVTGAGDVKVGDFGIARAASSSTMTKTGSILGTAHYISPEQAMGEPVGPRSDLYSLGIVLYEMLTGTLPYDAETPIGIAMKHVNGYLPPPRSINPDVPEGMNAITCRLLAKDPDDRYADAGELIEDLERVLEGLPPSGNTTRMMTYRHNGSPARRSNVAQLPARETRGRRWTIPVLLLLLLAAIGAIAYSQVRESSAQSLPVPNLEKARNIDQAVDIASRVGFEVRLGDRKESREPVGEIVEQKPAPGDQAVTGSTIVLDVSGAQVADVPNVDGMTEGEAKEALEREDFKVEVKRAESSAQDDGRVISQDPAGGEDKTARVGSTVGITVGSGLADMEVPELFGQTPDQAAAILERAGLELGRQAETSSEEIPEGQIVGQQPLPGTSLKRGSSVAVTVSTGSALVPVPNVTGQPVETAQETLYNAFFYSEVVEVESDLPVGTVVSTNPAPGTPVDPYAVTVTVGVSLGPPPPPPPPPPPVQELQQEATPRPAPQAEPTPEPSPQPAQYAPEQPASSQPAAQPSQSAPSQATQSQPTQPQPAQPQSTPSQATQQPERSRPSQQSSNNGGSGRNNNAGNDNDGGNNQGGNGNNRGSNAGGNRRGGNGGGNNDND